MRALRRQTPAVLFAAGAALLAPVATPSSAADAYDTGRIGFAVEFDGLRSDYRVLGLFVLPGEELRLGFSQPVRLRGPAVPPEPTASLTWKAPTTTGLHVLEAEAGGATMRLNLFVQRPATAIEQERLDGYRIGSYPKKPFRNLATYRAPSGYVAVTPELRDARVSPHFTLGQFLCKQESGWPKMVVLRTRLVLKLERILEEINRHGIRTDSLVVMSGFRTPWYNASIGNKTSSSRHLFGGAADIYVDVSPQDGVMDDLNRDGRVDKADAQHLQRLIDDLQDEPWWQPFLGGLSSYGTTAAHGPFVHVDVRGYRARW